MRVGALGMTMALTGCATYLDPNYAIQIEAYRANVAAQQSVEIERARAETARYQAMEAIATFGDNGTRNMALVALALSGRNGDASARVVNVALPQAPESQEARAFKWAALFAAPVATLAQGYFGYRLGAKQSDNATQASIASYNALGSVAGNGFHAAEGIATQGFGTATAIAGAGFGAVRSIIPAIQPNITLSGSGVVGSGSFVGPNSGTASGNSGDLHYQSPVTTNPQPSCVPAVDQPC